MSPPPPVQGHYTGVSLTDPYYHSQTPSPALPDLFASPSAVPNQNHLISSHSVQPQAEYHNLGYSREQLPTPASYSPYPTAYEDNDDLGDAGDLPLLRAPSQQSQISSPSMPGAKDMPTLDDGNIRYGRIPQRVPRRYKTIKKVEYVQVPLFCSTLS
jgi:hypothetical protein